MGRLWTRETQAPSYAELRPFGDPETSGFPVYQNLEELLLQARVHPDPVVAHVMATCAAYAYSGPETVSMIMARMGLADNRCRMIQLSVDAMLLRSTAFVVQSRSGRVAILCYRGTEPLNLINWMLTIDLEPERIGYQIGDQSPAVHGGFYRNTRATRYEVMNTLKRACEGRSVLTSAAGGGADADPMVDGELEALYITGHSLGGAMAALMAVMIKHEDKFRTVSDRLSAVYTFGQPMVGNRDFAKNCQDVEFLRDNVIRYVYDSDLVPHLPPAVSGAFRHFGREHRYRIPLLSRTLTGLLGATGCEQRSTQGKWEESSSPASQAHGVPAILLAGAAFVAGKFQLSRALPVVYSIDDHFPRRYVSSLTPSEVNTEFGD
ncbi:lipase family protein [Spirillospora sp. CA-255316]